MKISKYLHVEVDLTPSHGRWIEGFVSALRRDEDGEIVNISIPEGYVQITLLDGTGVIHARVGQLRPRFDDNAPAVTPIGQPGKKEARGDRRKKQNANSETAY